MYNKEVLLPDLGNYNTNQEKSEVSRMTGADVNGEQEETKILLFSSST